MKVEGIEVWYNIGVKNSEDSMAKNTVFHGSYVEIRHPEIHSSKNTKDFGEGFYCTMIREQAVRWSRRYKTPVVNVYTLNMRVMEQLFVKEFKEMTDEWLDFIIDCRSGRSHGYDVVIGAMANDQIYNYISDYIAGSLTREQFWVMAKFKYPTHQITFCTEKSLACLEFVSSEECL